MRYFTRSMEDKLVQQVKDEPDQCVKLGDEYYREDGNVLVYRDNRSIFLHRLLYKRAVGSLSRGMFLVAACDTEGCVNPHHRDVVPTPKRAATHCPRGHLYEDSRRDARGRRYCLECRRLRDGYTGEGSPTSEMLAERERRKRFCPRGHEYTDENTYRWVDRKGSIHRSCKACKSLNRSNRKASL